MTDWLLFLMCIYHYLCRFTQWNISVYPWVQFFVFPVYKYRTIAWFTLNSNKQILEIPVFWKDPSKVPFLFYKGLYGLSFYCKKNYMSTGSLLTLKRAFVGNNIHREHVLTFISVTIIYFYVFHGRTTLVNAIHVQ